MGRKVVCAQLSIAETGSVHVRSLKRVSLVTYNSHMPTVAPTQGTKLASYRPRPTH